MKNQKSRLASESGNAFVLMAIFLMVLLAFAGLALDIGNTLTHKKQVQDIADATALGAIPEWGWGDTIATTIGAKVASNNPTRSTDAVAITLGVWHASSTNFTATSDPSNFQSNSVPAVRVEIARVLQTCFLNLFGWPTLTARGQSIAIAGRANGAYRVQPLVAAYLSVPNPSVGQTLTLKYSEVLGPPGPGNAGAANLPGNHGGKDFYNIIATGNTDSIIYIGQTLQALPGNKSAKQIADAINTYIANNGSLATVAITDYIGPGSSDFKVIGFWTIALTAASDKDPGVTGTFVEAYGGTQVDPKIPPGISLSGVALVQ